MMTANSLSIRVKSEEKDVDCFAPDPPAGYAALRATSSQILLPLTISNKCGQAFRWRANQVWQPKVSSAEPEWKQDTEWSLCLADRVVLLRQDEQRGFLYHRTLLPPTVAQDSVSAKLVDVETGLWLQDYLNLNVPLEALYREWAERDKVFARYADRFSGLRMLRQDPWECLCAFICSSNNNIARIGQMVQNLCTHFSPVLVSHTYPPSPLPSATTEDEEEAELSSSAPITITYHPFPPPEALAQEGVEEKLRLLGFGYRAKYLARTAQMLCEKHTRAHSALSEQTWLYGVKQEGEPPLPLPLTIKGPPRKRSRASSSIVKTEEDKDTNTISPHSVRSYLQSLRSMSYEDARSELMVFPGVGPKVADCVLLMSLDQHSSIPVDRHVFQFAEKWYHIRSGKYEDIAQRFRDLWGEYAGWAHSVLFTADLRSFASYNTEPPIAIKSEIGVVPVKKEDPDLAPMPHLAPSGAVVVKTEPMAISDLQRPTASTPLSVPAHSRPKRKSRT